MFVRADVRQMCGVRGASWGPCLISGQSKIGGIHAGFRANVIAHEGRAGKGLETKCEKGGVTLISVEWQPRQSEASIGSCGYMRLSQAFFNGGGKTVGFLSKVCTLILLRSFQGALASESRAYCELS